MADATKNDQKAKPNRLSDADWWRELAKLSSLAQSQRDALFDVDIMCDPVNVLNVVEEEVTIRNLYASQTFPGIATLSAIPPHASVKFAGQIPLIAADHLLEGPSVRFTADSSIANSSPILTPSDDPSAPIELKAGSLVPHLIGDDERLVFDQSGRVSLPISETKWHGRHVRIPTVTPQFEGTLPVAGYFQWSYRELDLSTDKLALKLHFVGLPVSLDGDRKSVV